MMKFVFCLVINLVVCITVCVAQEPELEFLFPIKNGYSNADSALVNPESVCAFYFECDKHESFLNTIKILNRNKIQFGNLHQISFDINCDIDSFPISLFDLPSLSIIESRYKPYIYRFPELYNEKIIKLALSSPPGVESQSWQKIFFNLINIKTLDLSFEKSVAIHEEIAKLKHLEVLKLFSTGDISYPKSISQLPKLKSFSIAQCLSCESFPDSLPVSIEYISIRYTKVKQLSSNLCSLTNLRYLDLQNSKIQKFPEGFNFAQLDYFAAPKDLFSDEQWKDINIKVKRVVIGQDRKLLKEKTTFGKRN